MGQIESEQHQKMQPARLECFGLIDQTVLCSIVLGRIVSYGTRKKDGGQSRANHRRGAPFNPCPSADISGSGRTTRPPWGSVGWHGAGVVHNWPSCLGDPDRCDPSWRLLTTPRVPSEFGSAIQPATGTQSVGRNLRGRVPRQGRFLPPGQVSGRFQPWLRRQMPRGLLPAPRGWLLRNPLALY